MSASPTPPRRRQSRARRRAEQARPWRRESVPRALRSDAEARQRRGFASAYSTKHPFVPAGKELREPGWRRPYGVPHVGRPEDVGPQPGPSSAIPRRVLVTDRTSRNRGAYARAVRSSSIANKRSATRAGSTRYAPCSYSLVIHGRQLPTSDTASSAIVRSTYSSSQYTVPTTGTVLARNRGMS